jgi:hypothetical protein
LNHLKTLHSPYRVTLSPAACSLDLGDGSERGEYVNQDYILTTLGRPHRSISLMYCYYPLTKGWPKRASLAHKRRGKIGSWDYPYDDYFPFPGGPKGDTEAEAFQQMRDIRRHGQDVALTLTMDCAVPNDHIRILARQLKPYGRLRLRLNHECDGFWFTYSRNYTYQQVADFFVRFSRVLKKEAPLVRLITCWGHVEDFKTGRLTHEMELLPTLKAADLWSADQYFTLHYRWPLIACEPQDLNKTHKIEGVPEVWRQLNGIHKRFVELTGEDKGLEIGEINADGNVGGEAYQTRLSETFYRRVLREKRRFLKGITYYQFRDRGRLGLEREDPNNPSNGQPTPFLPIYKELLQEPYFQPRESWTPWKGPLRMEWRESEDSDGLGWKLSLKKRPIFLELLFEKKDNLLIKGGMNWFYKKPGVEWIDMTQAAVDWGVTKPFPIVVLAPPADGMNPGGSSQVTTKLPKAPRIRLLYHWKA